MVRLTNAIILLMAFAVLSATNRKAASVEWSDISPTAPKIEKKNLGVKKKNKTKEISPKTKPREDFSIVNSYDMIGEAYHNIRDISHGACKSRCRSDGRCVAYTYNIWNQWCFLKARTGQIFLEPASISGIKKNYSVPDKTYWSIKMAKYLKRVFPGHTFKKLRSSSFDECQAACRQDDACVVFTYSRRTSDCDLKDFAEEYTRSSYLDSGVKRQRQ